MFSSSLLSVAFRCFQSSPLIFFHQPEEGAVPEWPENWYKVIMYEPTG